MKTKRKNQTLMYGLMTGLSLAACAKSTNSGQSLMASAIMTPSSRVTTIKHPGMLHTAADFTRMTTNVNAGNEPWLSGWNKLVANGHSSSTYNPRPVVTIVSSDFLSSHYGTYLL
jgi:hypothetical protein